MICSDGKNMTTLSVNDGGLVQQEKQDWSKNMNMKLFVTIGAKDNYL